MKRFLKISGYIVATIFLLLLVIVALVNYSPVQSYIAKKAAGILSDKLETKVEVAHVRIGLLNSVLVQGIYIEGQEKDTLLYAGEIQVRITDWFIFKDKPVIHFVGLQDAYVHLYRKADSNGWNYDFIADAFSSPKKKDKKKSQPIEFDLKKVELKNVRFHMDDKWIGEDMDYDIGYLIINTDDIDFKKKIIDVEEVAIKDTRIFLNEYKGGRPKHLRPKYLDTFDVTPFNPDKWVVQAKNVSMERCAFHLKSDDNTPVAGHFDESHIEVKDINFTAGDIHIDGDTLHGNINTLSAEDRSGLAIKKMHTKVTISPIASICEDLYLETNHSVLQNYYAMHYRHFPDFNHYIDSVTMVVHMRNAHVDKRDITYFAPELADFPEMLLTISGDAKGTVPNLTAKKLNISDGNVAIKGDLTMKGLPDIYTTYITYTDGEILTTGKGITHYAPALKNNPDIAVDSISYAYFFGGYEGYIEDFNVNGIFKTNIGTLATDIHMAIPGFNSDSAVYAGTISTDKLQLGKLLRQSMIGDITLDEKIAGNSFNPDFLQLQVDGKINEFGVNGYAYHNILTDGTLAKKQFDGRILVDDPNLGLDFDGSVNYAGKQLKIDAKAHLLGSNFKALNFTSDNVTATADFDLDWTGSNIDNFSGYAKLFNIDLKRNEHILAIDSVYLRSSGDTAHRKIGIFSDAFTASINGNYKLSDLPTSIQYYLSRYMPSYIKAPEKYAPAQELSFTINTTSIDSIFAVTVPMLRGFDSSTISGSLNTAKKQLTLNANVPYFSVADVHFHNVSVIGEGDFDILALNTTVGNTVLGDSILNGSLSLTTTIGNDSANFNLATVAPDKESSITLNGRVVAKNDSLLLTVFPSQFYMKKSKWDIAGGSNIIYTKNFLQVSGVALTSGIQRVSVESKWGTGQSLVVNAENLDLAQIGNWTGLSGYQPDGRLNGTISVDGLFKNLLINANIKASGVKMGMDTIGFINLIGSYDDAKKLIHIDPQTGIYRDNATLMASGFMSLDSASKRKVEGAIRFNNAKVTWASPFLVGLMSHLSGSVNGTVTITGTSDKPVIDGKLSLANAGLKLDYMGCYYTIPYATVGINNKRIDLGEIQIFDSYKNKAILSGYFSHDLFSKMRMRMKITTPKFEVLNLARADNEIFYGKLIASMDSFTIRGAFDNIRLSVHNGAPAAKSTIFIPVSSGGYVGGYNYVSFKTYGKEQDKTVRKSKDKISITIDAEMNTLCQLHIVLDPTTEDEIVATGTGNIHMDIPPSNDMQINGLYTISDGSYVFTLQQFAIHKQFKLTPGSTISFNGPFAETNLSVDATYSAKARMYDLLSENEKQSLPSGSRDATDAQTPQWVNVILHMRGPIYNSKLTFDLDLDNNHSQGTLAYKKLMIINNDDRQKFDQVASLLLVNQFISTESSGQNAALTGAINNISQIISTTASSGLTSIVNKLIGNRNLNVAVKYTNYNYNGDQASGNSNRSQVKLGVTKNYLNDRLLISVGSTSDWGKPTTSNTATNFNLAGDFRLQYQLSERSGLRLNAFHNSDYDLTRDQNIQRTGVGISWRKSFDNLGDFFGKDRREQKRKEKLQTKAVVPAKDTTDKSGKNNEE